jgi:hypothetical protein
MLELLKTPYSNVVFRCFNSVKPSQHLLDDIGLGSDEQAVAAEAYYDEDLETLNPHQRVLERSEYGLVLENIHSKFHPSSWMDGRFSDGTWAVLYSAESENTALAEKTFHIFGFYKEEAAKGTVDVDLAVAKLNVQTNQLIDVSAHDFLDQNQLSSPDLASYKYCQSIAKQCLELGAEALRNRSARDADGFCIPIFSSQIIRKDFGIQSWHKAEITEGSVELFTSDKKFQWL